MTTTKHLIEYLQHLPDDCEVWVIQGSKPVHLNLDMIDGNFTQWKYDSTGKKLLVLGGTHDPNENS